MTTRLDTMPDEWERAKPSSRIPDELEYGTASTLEPRRQPART